MELTDDRRITAGVLYSTIFHMMKRSPTKYVADGDIDKIKKLAEQNALRYERELTQGEREYILRLASKMGETMAEKARLSGQLQDHSGLGSGVPGGEADGDDRSKPTNGRLNEVGLRRENLPGGEDKAGDGPAEELSGHGRAIRPSDPGQAGPAEASTYDPDRALFACLAELRRLSEVQIAFVTEVIDRINSFNS